jgi:DNA-binding response OmpR family regulator
MSKIVIVEDELIAAEYLKEILQQQDLDVIAIIDNGHDAIQKIPLLNPDIVLMDIMLKDNISGSEVALHLKYKAPEIAIIFLTAYAETEMIDYAIESNSYGYLMKPYDEISIVSALKVIFAKIEYDKHDQTILSPLLHISNNLIFDKEYKRIFKNNVEIPLSVKPLAILETLCQHPNITVSTEELCLNTWGEIKHSSMLRTQISRLKKALKEDVIQNVKGLGYKIICI